MDFAAAMQSVVDSLRTLDGIDSADLDAGQVTPPGVLVQLAQITPGTLDHRTLDLQLVLVAPDTDGGAGAAAQLNSLLAAVESYATADGPIVARSVQLPTTPAPLPGLLFPLTVRTPE